ncbi:N-acetylglucosamine kinase [Pontibacillus litoralis]|uniref:ATPase BadF/BadG/BcrA/BcrD type domain-containing protein n=1 Tax=Pontibacillus litoralis JSM 072002 TaxID=1385512 RepID=A0A0A5HLY6_9BACI|nr:BadF/BadG/BcrA/BcrD ATPase family protein [Pontibacillus litoralis]KGX84642.1 hypothetical protein N784_12290 [Pontibacillus litoralis JSM 072002]
MTYLLGLDVGGTSTKAAIVHGETGEIIYETTRGCGNPVVDFHHAIFNIEQAILDCAAQINEDVEQVIIGMAGYETLKENISFSESISTLGRLPIVVVSDIELAYQSAFSDQSGVLVVSGTGSVMLAKTKDYNTYLRGGWGHLLGDHGSAYHIGVLAIQTLLESYERNIYLDFQVALKNEIDCHSATDVKKWFYSKNKSDIASLAHFINRCSNNGNNIAQNILKTAAKMLANEVETLLNDIESIEPLPVQLYGSVLKHNEIIQGEIMNSLLKLKGVESVQMLDKNPILGVISIYNKSRGDTK